MRRHDTASFGYVVLRPGSLRSVGRADSDCDDGCLTVLQIFKRGCLLRGARGGQDATFGPLAQPVLPAAHFQSLATSTLRLNDEENGVRKQT